MSSVIYDILPWVPLILLLWLITPHGRRVGTGCVKTFGRWYSTWRGSPLLGHAPTAGPRAPAPTKPWLERVQEKLTGAAVIIGFVLFNVMAFTLPVIREEAYKLSAYSIIAIILFEVCMMWLWIAYPKSDGARKWLTAAMFLFLAIVVVRYIEYRGGWEVVASWFHRDTAVVVRTDMTVAPPGCGERGAPAKSCYGTRETLVMSDAPGVLRDTPAAYIALIPDDTSCIRWDDTPPDTFVYKGDGGIEMVPKDATTIPKARAVVFVSSSRHTISFHILKFGEGDCPHRQVTQLEEPPPAPAEERQEPSKEDAQAHPSIGSDSGDVSPDTEVPSQEESRKGLPGGAMP